MLKYSEINRELNKTKDESNRTRNDINEEEKIQEKFNYQKNELELKSELNEKKKYIKNLENMNKINYIETEKFKNKMNHLDKMVTSKENEWNTKLNKLYNDAKKIDNYIKRNNDAKNELDIVEKECDKLLLKLNQSNEEKNRFRDKLKRTEDKLNKASIKQVDKKNLKMN